MIPLLTNKPRDTAVSVWLNFLFVSLTTLSLLQAQSVPADTDTPPFNTLYKWKQLDFEFPSPAHRSQAIVNGNFIPENVFPLGIEVWGSRVFISIPSWKDGVPATLATVPRSGGLTSPPLKPYPDWNFHRAFSNDINCSKLVSVLRMSVDQCGRLWVLDSGQIYPSDILNQACPPSIFLFDLETDTFIAKYIIPEEYVLQDSLFVTIVVDSSRDDCSDLHLYIADTWRFGLLVFREYDQKFWRFSHHLFYPEPLASNYSLHGTQFQWSEGIFGMALTPTDAYGQRLLYFHAMSSNREFYVPTSVLKQPARINDSVADFKIAGESRGSFGQSSTSAMDRRGVMFYGLTSRDSIGCWNSNKPYQKITTGVVALNTETLIFPNDVKVDYELRQSVWVLTNRLPIYDHGIWDPNDYNYRILYADTIEAVKGTICDPVIMPSPLTEVDPRRL